MKKIFLIISLMAAIAIGFSSCGNSSDTRLKAEIAVANEDFPATLEEGIQLVQMAEEGDNVVCYCEVDEGIYDMELIDSVKDNLKENIYENLSDPDDSDITYMAKLLVDANKNLVYRYVGADSGDAVDIVITVEDMKKLKK